MREVSPQVFVVGSTHIEPGLNDYLRTIGAIGSPFGPDWTTDAKSDGDKLSEVGGRLCYRSWMPWDELRPDCSNRNVSMVREGNENYLGNVLKSGHGSVFEHVYVNVIFHNVSRVFTHELVRHRAGMGYSQESLRFVRLNDLKVWVPGSLKELGSAAVDLFVETMYFLERSQDRMAAIAKIDGIKNFGLKKQLTSMFRRMAPLGLATTIMATGNVRSWRHVVNMRTDGGAEEEMNFVIPPLADKLKEMVPSCFQDMYKDEDGSYKFRLHSKV